MEALRLSTEETVEGVREGMWPVVAVETVDCEAVRRDLAIGFGYCCDEGDEAGIWGLLVVVVVRVYEG